jgi:hypothetical protein
LRRGLLTGRLGTDTFVARVDAAYRAKTHEDLAAVTRDLPRHRRIWAAVIERLATSAGTEPARPSERLRPPEMRTGEQRVLGRDRACDYTIADPAVSNRHAQLVRTSDGWTIRDLGSRNGTRVNGWLIDEQPLRDGDTLSLGNTTFVFALLP